MFIRFAETAFLASFGFVTVTFASCPDGVYRVTPTGSGTGCTWAAACNLDYALNNALAGESIWLKKGTYYRGTLGPVELKMGIQVLGGFSGYETAASQSTPRTNITTLDGRSSAGTPLPQGRVIESIDDHDPLDPNSGPVLRGVTIANGSELTINDNLAGGAGIFLSNSGARIVNCEIRNNQAAWDGAGAKIYNNSDVWFINCYFHDNGSGTTGDGFDGSAMPLAGGGASVWDASAKFLNCLFTNNVAGEGAGLELLDGVTSVINCTFVGNRAKITRGGGVYASYGAHQISNSVFRNNTVPPGSNGPQIGRPPRFGPSLVVNYSNIQGGWLGIGNINQDPLFLSPSSGDLRLKYASPSRNGGNGTLLPADIADLDWDSNVTEGTPRDLYPAARVIEGQVDMGSYETSCASPPVLDCNSNDVPDACEILENVSVDCDGNGVPDSCDLLVDPTKDCFDGNGVPDVCQLSIPKGACCIAGVSCNWPETSCRCAAQMNSVWHQGSKCYQISCGIQFQE